ncbi:MAG: regulatory protein RecX [Bacteroidota bacterium]
MKKDKDNTAMKHAPDPAGIYERISRYCAYQERCAWDAEKKLAEWKVPGGRISTLMKSLKDEGFIDDERFARTFVRGKFRINKWGRLKIGYELKGRKIPDIIIRSALLEISPEDYRKTVRELVLKKKSEIKPGKNLNIREKIITFVIGKGFEFDLAAEIIKELKI